MGLTIQIDSREKARAIRKILSEFDVHGVNYYISKLFTGDYMSLDNPRLIIDRKQNLTEVCSNVCQQHDRFRRELVRAQEMGVKLIILVEHGGNIKSLDDVAKWKNPRRNKRKWVDDECRVDENGDEFWIPGHYKEIETNAMTGKTLSKIMKTMEAKYGCEFLFCSKENTGRRIIEILGGGA